MNLVYLTRDGETIEVDTDDKASYENCLAHGWKLPEAPEDPKPVDLAAMTKAQLVTLAAEQGVEIPEGATKAQILEALKA